MAKNQISEANWFILNMYQYRREANRFDRDFAFEIMKKSEHSFFLKTKGKKRKCSIMNYRSFAITRAAAMLNLFTVRLYNEKIRQKKLGRAHSRSRNKTSCSSCIYNIQIRVQGKLILADLPSHWLLLIR
jgi:hypothetical protein